MVSRPSPAASRSTLATRSRSASEARRARGSGTAGELLISAKPRRTRARRYSGLPGSYRNLLSRSVRRPSKPIPFGIILGFLPALTGKLRFRLGEHPRDVPAEADVARVRDPGSRRHRGQLG